MFVTCFSKTNLLCLVKVLLKDSCAQFRHLLSFGSSSRHQKYHTNRRCRDRSARQRDGPRRMFSGAAQTGNLPTSCGELGSTETPPRDKFVL